MFITREQVLKMREEGFNVTAGPFFDELYCTEGLNTKRFHCSEFGRVLHRVKDDVIALAEYMRDETLACICERCGGLEMEAFNPVSNDHTGHLKDFRGKRVCDECCEVLYEEAEDE